MSSPDPESPDPPAASSRKTLVGGGAVLILGFGLDQLIRFGSTVVMTRLLAPHDFGVIALCWTFMVGLSLFSDLGLRTAIIQSKRGDEPAYLNTAYTVQVTRGFILWVAAAGLGYPAAFWREGPEPAMLWILPAIGFTAVLDGFTSLNVVTLQRHMGQARLVRFDLGCQAVAVAVQLTWASVDPSVRALVAGILVFTGLRCVGSHLLLPGPRSRFAWDRPAAWELAHFAGWIYVSTASWFLAAQTDKLVVGLRSLTGLGVYDIAVKLVQLPVTVCAAISGRLLFPYYAKLVNAGRELRDNYLNTHKMAGFLAGFFVTGVAAAGPALVALIYDTRYQEAGVFIPLLAVGGLFQILDANGGALLNAKGRVRAYAVSHFSKVLILTAGIPLGFAQAGMKGMIVALVVGDAVRYFVTCILLDRAGYRIFRTDIWWLLTAAGVGGATFFLRERLAESALPEHGKAFAAVTFAACVVTVSLLWLIVYAVGYRVGWLPHYRRQR